MDVITKLNITLSDIDVAQKIDSHREWRPIMQDLDESDMDKAVFVGFYSGDSPPTAEEIEYVDLIGTEAFWVYKTDYTIQDLSDGFVTPQELFKDVMEEQPNIEVAGLCKYVRNISPE